MGNSILLLTWIYMTISVVFGILFLVACWRIFVKANKPGWFVVIPVYNLVVFFDIINKSRWWIFLFLAPVINIVIIFIVKVELARAFDKSIGFGIGLIFLPMIFYPILGFGKSKYVVQV